MTKYLMFEDYQSQSCSQRSRTSRQESTFPWMSEDARRF